MKELLESPFARGCREFWNLLEKTSKAVGRQTTLVQERTLTVVDVGSQVISIVGKVTQVCRVKTRMRQLPLFGPAP